MTTHNRTITAFFDVTMRPGRVPEYSTAGAYGLDVYGWHVQDKRSWAGPPSTCQGSVSPRSRDNR